MSRVYSYRRMEPDDLRSLMSADALRGHDAQILDRFVTEGDLRYSYSGLRDGWLFGCAGLAVIWPGRAEGYAVFSTDVDSLDMRWVTRQVRAILPELVARLGLRRVEASALVDFKQANQWARMLGFSPVAYLPLYDPSGRDHRSYVRLWSSSPHRSSVRQGSPQRSVPCRRSSRAALLPR